MTTTPDNSITPVPSIAPDSSSSALLDDLTESQQRAVTTTEGPLLVLAAAGSGKTRVITRRAAYLTLELGIAPWQVLSITFTNKAAGEMRERVTGLMTERQARAMAIGTFHAQCVRLLREFHEAANLKADFTIFDATDQKRAIKQALNELNISTGNFSPGAMLGTISNAKNQLADATAFEAQASDFYDKTVARVYKAYETVLRRSGGLDFDDLLMKLARLLQHNDAVREELQERYAYV
ncbi:MAG: ATP-dependent helicase, partial [Planctomycetota bacterium]